MHCSDNGSCVPKPLARLSSCSCSCLAQSTLAPVVALVPSCLPANCRFGSRCTPWLLQLCERKSGETHLLRPRSCAERPRKQQQHTVDARHGRSDAMHNAADLQQACSGDLLPAAGFASAWPALSHGVRLDTTSKVAHTDCISACRLTCVRAALEGLCLQLAPRLSGTPSTRGRRRLLPRAASPGARHPGQALGARRRSAAVQSAWQPA